MKTICELHMTDKNNIFQHMKLKLLYITALLITASGTYSQELKIKKADKQYGDYAYIDAIKTYERVAEKGYKSEDIFKKLGNSYFFNSEFDKANKWYGELFTLNPNVTEPEYYYRYSQTLKSTGDYDKADKMLAIFNQKSGNDSRAKLYQKSKDYLKEIEDNSGRYSIENAGINSDLSDYGTSFLGNKLVFASTRIAKLSTKRVQEWNGQAFTNLYASEVDGDGKLKAPERFAESIDSKFNEDTPVFTNDGKTVYFTRNNYNKGKKKSDSENTTGLKIYKASLIDGKFTNVIELPFNNDEYNFAHPALSPDEKTMYFASDMPGSMGVKGQADLYKVVINADGTFGTPVNLGPKINTPGKETFPFVSNDNELYFSSDGQPGLGGLDVFVAKMDKDGNFDDVINVGKPVNSPMDDFAFLIDTKTQIGFVSSNREGGLGYDDIYKFKENKKLTCEQLIAGIVTDVQTGKVLADSKVSLFDEKMKLIKVVITDAKGEYSFDMVECKKAYSVRFEKKDYNTDEKNIVLSSETGKTDLSIALEPTVIPAKPGDDLAKVFKIEIIHFDLDKWDIRPDAAIDLAKIVDVMKQYPNMTVDVRSHTDSRQTFKYNQTLSDKRAKSTIDWMVSQGIEAGRLTGRGYGETQLLNKCADGVQCTEAEHQVNRRSEFIITSIK